MKIGIPKGLLYCRYYPFIKKFLLELGVEFIVSEDTNKTILNNGVKYSVDEACLPIKIFHGHVVSLVGKCDLIIIPRIMSIRKKEFICPKFCGILEMIKNSIPNLPKITELPIDISSPKSLYNWCRYIGKYVGAKSGDIKRAYYRAIITQKNFKTGIEDNEYKINIGLLGHPYNVYDNFVNMNLVKKLHGFGVGVVTEEVVEEQEIEDEINKLFKRPFWSFARNAYGAAGNFYKNKKVDGIIYISSFACGIDSVVVELIKNRIEDFPLLILKVDEQTGEAGFSTRIEAFVDMIERRKKIENNISKLG
ncbi:acyl-CoA dehydratase activase-related protein [Clostridium botulinum]|uniref:acyl-CoA dehydratase activase-related protein n=1 Tax=Clostridium botulinum TaxID=1491 RepID=UPI001E3DBDA0|nr:acyl-CoA dehydratase activase-related protein [Clostridium botulinum]MCD3300170.1 2-hydroxyglutaryl-CoA dehydratase [Clostridium botulinum D/C]MCD3306696.1 2-hydroxyglutaryl-CoA dehydratase [Clostridium botulinum D/C]